ncbi:MAG: 8-hydroxy-5-deazaflavin:NADPH oxidoreductase [Miltoncostaeaceae bacterium]|jgi:predicted dinucleotide-binding enzyme|nr:8-hydroxy-5-deazaflavin:NADPH oxidoreductase [Miltoncostaeaceae bacterium]
MRIAVLGTGVVGRTLGSRLVELGHQVRLGSRSAGNASAAEWAAADGAEASAGDFADAAAFGEVVLNCTSGTASLEALEAAGAANLAGKLLIDVANPLDFSQGFPPTLTVCNTDSLGEQIQRAFPEARVVKALNTINCAVMVDPDRVPGDHVLFMCGDDLDAKRETLSLLGELGWPAERVVDLGDIGGARGMEMYLPLWLRIMVGRGNADFNVRLAHG